MLILNVLRFVGSGNISKFGTKCVSVGIQFWKDCILPIHNWEKGVFQEFSSKIKSDFLTNFTVKN